MPQGSTKQRLWLCLPPAVLCAIDGGLTLGGQSSGYWSGDYALVEEMNPMGRIFLEWHPLAFAVGLVVWMTLVSVAILLLPRRAAFLTALAITLAHALGGATWMARHETPGWLAAVAFLAAGAYLAEVAWRKAGYLGGDKAGPEDP